MKEKVIRYLNNPPTVSTAKALCIYFAVISLLELLAYKSGGIVSILASRIWFCGGLFCLIVFGCAVCHQIIEDIRNKQYFLLLGMILALGVYIFYIGNLSYADINPDAAQQVASGLTSFTQPDWNYTKTAFLGYPSRQYLLAALPALLFGRSVKTLHWGFSSLFLIGIITLFLELRFWLRQRKLKEVYALLPIYAFFGFPFITEYFLNYEQAITPVALTMIGAALFLRIYRKPDSLGFLCLSWVGCFCCDSYTPVIASLGLLFACFGLYVLDIYKTAKGKRVYRETIEKYPLLILFIGLAVNILLFFVSTLLADRSDRLNQVRENISILPFIRKCIEEFLIDKNAVFLGIFMGIVILYLLFSLLGRLKFYDFVLAVWVLGVVVFSNYMVGYTTYTKAWIMQRMMIVIPILIIGIFLWGVRLYEKFARQHKEIELSILLLFFMVFGVYNFSQPHQSFTYFSYIQPMKYVFACMEDIFHTSNLDGEGEFNLVFYTDNILQTNLHDYALFFYPNAHTFVVSEQKRLEGLDTSLPTVILGENEDFTTLYSGETKCYSYQNKRYDTEVKLYVKRL